MAYSSIRTALKTRLEAISGVQNVHHYLRHISRGVEDPAYAALFVNGASDVHAWRFTRTNCAQTVCADHDSTIKRTHTIEIEGYRGLIDASASENTFQDLVDTVLTALNGGDKTLGGVAEMGIPQLTRFQPVMFYNVLCHGATIRIDIEENV